MTGLTFGFVALVYAFGLGTGWFIKAIEEYCKKGEE